MRLAMDPHICVEALDVVHLAGEPDYSVGEELLLAADLVARDGPSRVIVDMRDVTFIDGAVLRMLDRLCTAVRTQEGGSVLVAGASPWVRRVIALGGLEDGVELNDSGLATHRCSPAVSSRW